MPYLVMSRVHVHVCVYCAPTIVYMCVLVPFKRAVLCTYISYSKVYNVIILIARLLYAHRCCFYHIDYKSNF